MLNSVSRTLYEIENQNRKFGAIITISRLPPSTRRVLQALMAAEDYRLSFYEFRKAFNVKGRSYGPLLHRILDQSLIVPYGDLSGSKGYALTWYGKRALDADLSKKGA
jgi:hypothetical protein